MKEFKNRLQKVIEALGYENKNQFAKGLGQEPRKISFYLNGDNVPSQNFYDVFYAVHPEVNFDFLVTGRGIPIRSNSDASDTHSHLTKHNEILKEQIKGLRSQVNSLEKQVELNEEVIKRQAIQLAIQQPK